MKKRFIPVLAIVLGFAFSCVSPRGVAVSNIPVNPEQIDKNLGRAEAADKAWHIFMIPLKRPDIARAIEKGVQSKEGDAMINIQLYEKNINFILFGCTSAVVTGEVIKLKKIEPPATKK